MSRRNSTTIINTDNIIDLTEPTHTTTIQHHTAHNDIQPLQLLQYRIHDIQQNIQQLKQQITNKQTELNTLNANNRNQIQCDTDTLNTALQQLKLQQQLISQSQQQYHSDIEQITKQYATAEQELKSKLQQSEQILLDKRSKLQAQIENLLLFQQTRSTVHNEIQQAKQILKNLISEHKHTISYIQQQWHIISTNIQQQTDTFIQSYIQQHRIHVRSKVGLAGDNQQNQKMLDSQIVSLVQQCEKLKTENTEYEQKINALQSELKLLSTEQKQLAVDSIQIKHQIQEYKQQQSTVPSIPQTTVIDDNAAIQPYIEPPNTTANLQYQLSQRQATLQQLQHKIKSQDQKLQNNKLLGVCVDCYRHIYNKIQYRHNALYERAVVQYKFNLSQQDSNDTTVLCQPEKPSANIEVYDWSDDDRHAFVELLRTKLIEYYNNTDNTDVVVENKPTQPLMKHNNKQLLRDISNKISDMTFLTGICLDDANDAL